MQDNMQDNMIGLYSLVKAFDKCGTYLYEENKYKESQHYFQMSIEICENESNLSGYADLLDDMNDYHESVIFYNKAIHVEDDKKTMIPHYNLAQTIIAKCIELYANDKTDIKIEQLLTDSLEQFDFVFNNEKKHTLKYLRDKCIETLNMCLLDVIKIIDSVKHIAVKKENMNQLEIHSVLEEILCILQEKMVIDSKESILIKYVISWKNSIEQMPDYTIYNNKKKLFEKMNYFDDCCICLEHCLQIDLHCGHTVCTNCYKKIYEEPCPICRSKCELVD